MERLRIMAAECKCKEVDGHSKEQLTNGFIDYGKMVEIIRELTSVVNASSVTSAQSLTWAQRVEVQRTQTAVFESLKDQRV